MKELLDRGGVWKANGELLKGKIFIGDFIFNRAGFYEFELILAGARAGVRDGADVLAFIDPWSRQPLPDSTTLFGLGYQIDQQLRMIGDMNLAGDDRRTRVELFRQVAIARENILRALREKDSHIWIRDGITGQLVHPDFAEDFPDGTDVIEDFRHSIIALFDYFENLFGPMEIIERCQMKIGLIEKYLAGGMNIRIDQPLADEEILMQQRLILGYSGAIERSKARL